MRSFKKHETEDLLDSPQQEQVSWSSAPVLWIQPPWFCLFACCLLLLLFFFFVQGAELTVAARRVLSVAQSAYPTPSLYEHILNMKSLNSSWPLSLSLSLSESIVFLTSQRLSYPLHPFIPHSLFFPLEALRPLLPFCSLSPLNSSKQCCWMFLDVLIFSNQKKISTWRRRDVKSKKTDELFRETEDGRTGERTRWEGGGKGMGWGWKREQRVEWGIAG